MKPGSAEDQKTSEVLYLHPFGVAEEAKTAGGFLEGVEVEKLELGIEVEEVSV